MIDPPPELRVVRVQSTAEVVELTAVGAGVVDVGTAEVTEVADGADVTEAEVGGEATTAVKGRWLTSESALDTAQNATPVVAIVANNQSRTIPERFMANMLAETRVFRIKGG